MAKFSGRKAKKAAAGRAPGAAVAVAATHEGDIGFALDPKMALYTLAVTDLVGEDTFYESAETRDNRFVRLVHEVTITDPEWVTHFVPFLRDTAQMRSASIVVAAEYARAGGANARQVIASACRRADEPAEMLGYWLAAHGRRIPMAVKRGIADAAVRRYNERSALKYDGASRSVRMGDVIELTHPKPQTPNQSALFKHLLDRRHHHFELTAANVEALKPELPVIAAAHALELVPEQDRRAAIEVAPGDLAEAGVTWERLSGWLPGGMDREAWEAAIPTMGYMALLRNLRNFEQAGVRDAILDRVAAKLADPEEVRQSRQFPYRFWSAYQSSGTVRFAPALEQALQHSLVNIPDLPGRSLVLIDTSSSMSMAVSAKSKIRTFEIGAVFACAAAKAAERSAGDVELVLYATGSKFQKLSTSVLRTVQDVAQRIGEVGHGTDTWKNAQKWYDGHDRVIVFTDMQDHPGNAQARQSSVDQWPASVYVWDLRGYGRANIAPARGRHLFTGFTDAAFRLIPLLEAGRDGAWPWESPANAAA